MPSRPEAREVPAAVEGGALEATDYAQSPQFFRPSDPALSAHETRSPFIGDGVLATERRRRVAAEPAPIRIVRLAYPLRPHYMQKRMSQTPISFLYALREAADACDERMTPICAMAGLTLAQFNLLYLVVEEKRTRLGELAENSRCVKSNVTYLVRSMEGDGLLEVVADPDDRRVRHVRATPKGTKALRAALRAAGQLEKELRAGFGEKAMDDATERLMAVARRFDGL